MEMRASENIEPRQKEEGVAAEQSFDSIGLEMELPSTFFSSDLALRVGLRKNLRWRAHSKGISERGGQVLLSSIWHRGSFSRGSEQRGQPSCER